MSAPLAAGLCLFAGLAAAGISYLDTARQGHAELRWDGAGWALRGADAASAEPGHPELMLDGGDWMLLRWHHANGGSVGWLPLTRAAAGVSGWHALRVAVQAGRAAPVGVQGGQP